VTYAQLTSTAHVTISLRPARPSSDELTGAVGRACAAGDPITVIGNYFGDVSPLDIDELSVRWRVYGAAQLTVPSPTRLSVVDGVFVLLSFIPVLGVTRGFLDVDVYVTTTATGVQVSGRFDRTQTTGFAQGRAAR
jgi:hypothetical protein